MEFGLKIFLVSVAVAIIGAILLDGYRKVKVHRNQLRFKLEPIDELDDLPTPSDVGTPRKIPSDQIKPTLEARFDNVKTAYAATPKKQKTGSPIKGQTKSSAKKNATENSTENTSKASPDSETAQDSNHNSNPDSNHSSEDYQDVIMLNLMPKSNSVIEGEALLKALLLCGMRFGEKSLFHYYENQGERDKAIFSLVNLVQPGTFILDEIDRFTSPGICMFMSLPGPKDPIAGFEIFILTAHKIAKKLNLELHDELHRPLTEESLKHAQCKVLQFKPNTQLDADSHSNTEKSAHSESETA